MLGNFERSAFGTKVRSRTRFGGGAHSCPSARRFRNSSSSKGVLELVFFFLISRQGKEKEKEKKTSYIKECPTKQKWGEAGEILNIKTISSRNRYRDSQQMVGVGKRWKWKEGKQN